MRLSEAAKTERVRFSTIDIMVSAPAITGPAFALALQEWFAKQRNVSHLVKSALRSDRYPYYVTEGGGLGTYGRQHVHKTRIEMGEDYDEDD